MKNINRKDDTKPSKCSHSYLLLFFISVSLLPEHIVMTGAMNWHHSLSTYSPLEGSRQKWECKTINNAELLPKEIIVKENSRKESRKEAEGSGSAILRAKRLETNPEASRLIRRFFVDAKAAGRWNPTFESAITGIDSRNWFFFNNFFVKCCQGEKAGR